MGTKFDGDHFSRGINFMGIVYPGGQEVGDQKSGDQMSSGPNASQLINSLLFVYLFPSTNSNLVKYLTVYRIQAIMGHVQTIYYYSTLDVKMCLNVESIERYQGSLEATGQDLEYEHSKVLKVKGHLFSQCPDRWVIPFFGPK